MTRMMTLRRRAPAACVAALVLALVLALGLAAPAGGARAAGGGDALVAYRVEIDAPAPFDALLAAELDLVRWQGYETMTADLLERLVGEARARARDILNAHGHFAPRVGARIATQDGRRVVQLQVEPGELTRVSAVRLRFSGPIVAGDERDREIMAQAEARWSLPAGAVFTQAAWERAKQQAAEALARQRYLGAHVVASEARVDPQRHAAALELTVDSGPLVRFGPLEIFGLSKYEAARVRSLWTFAHDAAFDREILERFQRRLAAVPYFASAYVDVDPLRISEARVPLRVSVSEAPAKRLEAGLRFSTDHGLGGSFGYQHRNFLERAWRLRLRAEVQQRTQLGEASIDLPERPDGWAEQASVRLQATAVENLETEDLVLGWRRVALEERRQPLIGVLFVQSRQRAPGVLSESAYATLPYAGYTWRGVDDLVSPRRGTNAQLEFGVAPPGLASRGFARVIGRIDAYRALGPRRDLLLRAQGGAVLASSSSRIPQTLLFRTGGSATVRGYDLDSLGVVRGSAVLGGRYFALASAEVTQWISEQLGVAGFVDAGNAADEPRALKPAYGIGGGLRARTPLGPFRLDLAYGEARQAWRLHFSIAVSL